MNSELQALKPETAQALKQTMAAMEQPKTVYEVREMLERDDKERIKQNYRNCMTVLQLDPLLHGAICYNILTNRVDIVKPLGWKRFTSTLTDTDKNYILLYMEDNYGLANDKKIEKAISIMANENRYHPIRDLLNSLVWDGKERIRFVLHHFLGVASDEYTYEAMKIFLLGSINRAFRPGSKFDMMLCLAGGQGAGKSTFFRFLAIKDEWFSDDLRKLDDENVYRKLQGHWIMEMSEMLATASAKSIEEIKAFLSRQKETYKIPYETHPQDRPRQCVFGGTSNAMDFLPLDRTGNRRFIPILVNMDEAEVHIMENEAASREYLLQVWAEAMEIYRSGDYELKFSQSMSDYLVGYQEQFMPEDTWIGMIEGFLENYKGNRVCSRMLYQEALNHPYDEPNRKAVQSINTIMNAMEGWTYFKNSRMFPKPYLRQRGWERDEKEQDFVAISDEEVKQLQLPKEWLNKK